MTVSTATSRIEYTGDAVTTAFSFPYYFLANGDLKVYLDGVLQTITTHYTVAGAGVPAGGTVTFVTAPPNGDVVVIYRQVAITQPVDYTPNDPFPANTHEQALDRLTMITQQLDEEAGRALALPSTSTYSDLTLPDPQAGYFLQWKADLSGLQNVIQVPTSTYTVSAYGQTLIDDADAAAALSTLGLTVLPTNTAYGHSALDSFTSGSNNVAIGTNALTSTTSGQKNVCAGANSGYSFTIGSYNVCLGDFSGRYQTGSSNTAVGDQSLYGQSGLSTASANVAVGAAAGSLVTTGGDNVFVGAQAGEFVTTGTKNTIVGRLAGTIVTTGTNITLLGYDAEASAAGASNEITLGDANVTNLRCYDTTITSPSDARDKANITTLNINGIDFINSLRPVTWNWDRRDWYDNGVSDGSKIENRLVSGFIAQELKAAQCGKEFLDLVYESNPDKLEAKYGKLIIPLVKAVQELSNEVELLKSKLKLLE